MRINRGNGMAGPIRTTFLLVLAAVLLTAPLGEMAYAERIYGVPASEFEASREAEAEETTASSSGDCEITIGGSGAADAGDGSSAIRTGSGEGLLIHGIEAVNNVPVNGDALVWKIYQYLLQEGFSTASACGILGNIQRESDFHPESGSLSDVYGLFQMKGSYLQSMLDHCAANGQSYTNGMAQVEAMIRKLAPELFRTYTGHHKVYDWNRRQAVDDGSNHYGEAGYCWWYDAMTLEDYKKIDDAAYAAEVWRRVVERNTGSASDISKRGNFARAFYQQYKAINEDASDIIRVGSQYIGNPYVWGGSSLTDGIDCSHFVCKILTMTGHYDGKYRTSASLRNAGIPVASLAEAMPGDVLCYDGHVVFYVGPNTILHAAGRKRGIVMDHNINIQKYHGGLLAIRRFR